MAFQPAPTIAAAHVRYTIDGQEIENVFNFKFPGTPTAGQLTTLGEEMEDWALTVLMPNLSNGLVYRETYVVDLGSQNGAAVTVAGGGGGAPGTAGAATPNNVALCVSLNTGLRGRSYRGRAYIAGLGKTFVTASKLETGNANAIKNAVGALMQQTTISAGVLCVLSRYINKTLRVEGIGTPVLSVTLNDFVVDSQRRRLPGRGQ